MNVTHSKPQGDITAGSFTDDVWAYRTEAHNSHPFSIRVVWFQCFTQVDGVWYGNNIKNRVLREADFAAWYAEGDPTTDAWLQPGQTAACDPNWHYGQADDREFGIKWAFLSVDDQGNTYFDEAEVTRETAQFFQRNPSTKETPQPKP